MTDQYQVTIGLEIHAQLKTVSKMFCACLNDPEEAKPNVNICPVCVGHPGTLPVINKQAVLQLLRVGLALGGRLADFTEFDRKHYFYPDIPKGYQISQYKHPLVTGGSLLGVELERVHLEEDTARSSHDQGPDSLVDFNRSGQPLMELVTKPVIKGGEQAADFARELRLLLRYLEAGEANMEKGQMRVEANISLSNDPSRLGTKVEVKNLNSFKSVEKAVAYEIERQGKVLSSGQKVAQETRGWDEGSETTVSQRSKEESHDYRYFPEPDLPPLRLDQIEEFQLDSLRQTLPELPQTRRDRYRELGLKDQQLEILVNFPALGDYFDQVLIDFGSTVSDRSTELAANYITSDLSGLVGDGDFSSLALSAANFSRLITMIIDGDLSSRGAKDLLAILATEGGDPLETAKIKGLLQSSDDETMLKLAQQVVESNPEAVSGFSQGKESSLQFLIGQGMKLSQGSANPQKLKEKILDQLK